MKSMTRAATSLLGIMVLGYLFILGWYYLNQEQLIFRPSKLDAAFEFTYSLPFEEVTITTEDDTQLHGLLFKADSTKGLAFYLHGNAGALDRWGREAELFVQNGFDIFIMDYRGYGKSTGTITSEQQFLRDIDTVYQHISAKYRRQPRVITGYSIGTGPAAWLARKYSPELLILKAPYYNIPDLAADLYPFLPGWLAKYRFTTNEYLQEIDSKVVIFHGDEDGLIRLDASKRLRSYFTEEDTLIVLPGQGHNGIRNNQIYQANLRKMLERVSNQRINSYSR